MSRAYIPLKVKLAAALLKLGHVRYEDAKLMTADQICSLYQFHHWPIPKAHLGPDLPWNLEPRLIADHHRSTNVDNGSGRSDRTMIARLKPKRKKYKRKWASRPFPKRRAA
jgi:hypothetical protein